MKNQLKYLQNLFYDLLNDYGQVYLLVKYSENSAIGKRGFTDEERQHGIVLVFNQKNHRNLSWDEDGNISASLGFGAGNRREDCFLHADDIVSVFSPSAMIRFERWDTKQAGVEANQQQEKVEEKPRGKTEKVVSMDRFRKKKG